MHFGANIGAAQDPGNTVQASDDGFEATLADSDGRRPGCASIGAWPAARFPTARLRRCIAAAAATCRSSAATRCFTIQPIAAPMPSIPV